MLNIVGVKHGEDTLEIGFRGNEDQAADSLSLFVSSLDTEFVWKASQGYIQVWNISGFPVGTIPVKEQLDLEVFLDKVFSYCNKEVSLTLSPYLTGN